MKKRFLSAVLALAMALTLLPATVFAAAATQAAGDGTETATYVAKNGTYGETAITDAPGWYAQVKGSDDEKNKTYYIRITTGFIISGKYYASFPMKKDSDGKNTSTPVSTTFTSIGNVTASLGDAASVNADVYSGTLTLTVENDVELTSITVKDTRQDNAKSEVSLPSGWPSVADKAFTLSLTNVGSTSAVDGAGVGGTAAVAGKVALDNSKLGAITLVGTVGTKTAAQTVELKNGSESGAITVTGGTSGNKITIADSSTGSPTPAAVTMTSAGGSIEVSGQSVVGAITVSSGETTTAKAVAVPSVKVTGGSVGEITRSAGDKSTTANSITVSGGRTSANGITTANGSVTVTSAKTGTIAVTDGSVAVNGPNARVENGGVIAGEFGNGYTNTGKVSIKVTGSGNVIKAITNRAATLTVDLPADPTNNYGTINDNGVKKYSGHNVKGGAFAAAVPAGWLANKGADALVFQLKAGNNYTYYNGSQLGDALTAQNKDAGNTLTYVGTGASPKQTITFKNGDATTWGELKSDGLTPIILPTQVAGVAVNSWFDGATTYPAGSSYVTKDAGTGNSTVELNAQETSANASKLTNASATSTAIDESVYVSLSGTVINVSGGVSTDNQVGGGIPVAINLYTDVDETPVSVKVVYNPTSGAVNFVAGQTLDKGMTLEASGYSGLDTLRLSNGTKYTLNGSAIKVLAGDLEIDAATEVVVTARVSGLSDKQNKELAKDLASGAVFDWSGSPLMAQAVNAAAATISGSQFAGWINNAQRAAWNAKNTGKLPDNLASEVGGFTEVNLIPYLAVNVTAFNDNGAMTATLTPSYRVVVKNNITSGTYKDVFKGTSSGDAAGNYVVQTGRALGSLAGELGQIDVTLGLTGKLATAYMHQDGTYVYQGASGKFEITHGSTNGLGTVVLNTAAPLVTMVDDAEAPADAGSYDALQAAVDDAKDGYTITVGLGYKGGTTISVTGVARKFTIKTEGSHNIASNVSGIVTPEKDGKTFTVQLTRDTAAPGQNIVIASVTGGVAAVSANPATAGQTVTVTLTPAAGYVSNGIAVKTNTGAAVSVSGSDNAYTFVMPANAATVTVTPAFKAADNKATISVASANGGTAYTSAAATDNKAEQGSTVTVTTVPTSSNYRTMGLTARSNTGAAAAVTRTGTDTFSVTVPSGATTVTLTPSFDFNNGTPFTDVPYSLWSSDNVSWMYKNGYTTGYGDSYHFAPTTNATRWEMVYFLYKAARYPSVTGMSNPFKDVNTSQFYYNAVIWAANKGLIDSSSGYFNPTASISRADVVYIIWRQKDSPAASTTNGFIDVPSSAYYAKAVSWAEKVGVTNGKDNRNTFKPNLAISRQEIAKMIHVAFG